MRKIKPLHNLSSGQFLVTENIKQFLYGRICLFNRLVTIPYNCRFSQSIQDDFQHELDKCAAIRFPV